MELLVVLQLLEPLLLEQRLALELVQVQALVPEQALPQLEQESLLQVHCSTS
jgi:hypothetical protein